MFIALVNKGQLLIEVVSAENSLLGSTEDLFKLLFVLFK